MTTDPATVAKRTDGHKTTRRMDWRVEGNFEFLIEMALAKTPYENILDRFKCKETAPYSIVWKRILDNREKKIENPDINKAFLWLSRDFRRYQARRRGRPSVYQQLADRREVPSYNSAIANRIQPDALHMLSEYPELNSVAAVVRQSPSSRPITFRSNSIPYFDFSAEAFIRAVATYVRIEPPPDINERSEEGRAYDRKVITAVQEDVRYMAESLKTGSFEGHEVTSRSLQTIITEAVDMISVGDPTAGLVLHARFYPEDGKFPSNKELEELIGEQMKMNRETLRTHQKNIFSRLHTSTLAVNLYEYFRGFANRVAQSNSNVSRSFVDTEALAS